MQVQKEWNKPELSSFGSVEEMTEATVTKTLGIGDFIILNVPNPDGSITTTNNPAPGGPAISVSL